MPNHFEPKLVTVLREGYDRRQFVRDLSAGVLVGVVALPLAIAFAIASGVKPEQGLYTAIVAGLVIAVLSGSRVQIGGPTGAFIVLVYAVVQQHGYEGLAVATILAGLLLVCLGLARLGTLIQYIPYPVTVGFTAGIAVVIATSQIRDALGLRLGDVPAEFLAKWTAFGGALSSYNLWAVAVTVTTILVLLGVRRFVPRVPGLLVALLLTTVAAHLLRLPVETIGSRFGAISSSLPAFHFPHVPWHRVPELFSPALSIALLAGIESLLSAVVADGMTGRRHRSDMELVAQGAANVVSPLFGGIPATGAIARTAANVKSGGRTPIAGIVHALTLLVILLVAGPWAGLVPLATLAGILLVVAYDMSEPRLFLGVLKSTRSDALVLGSTFLLTVLVDLTVAIQVGVVLAAFLFMKRMAEVTQVRAVTGLLDESEPPDPELEALRHRPAGVEVYEINGPFFFGAAHKFKATLSGIQRRPKVLVLRMRHVLALDATGLRAFEELLHSSERGGTKLIVSGLHAQPLVVLDRAGLVDRIGRQNLVGNLAAAFGRARILLGEPTVAGEVGPD